MHKRSWSPTDLRLSLGEYVITKGIPFGFLFTFTPAFMSGARMYSTIRPSFWASSKADSLEARPTPYRPLAYVPPPTGSLQYTVDTALHLSCLSRLVSCNPTTSQQLCLRISMISMAWTNYAVMGHRTDVGCAYGHITFSILQSCGLSYSSMNFPLLSPLPCLFASSSKPSNIWPSLGFASLPTCRVQHSRPATSASVQS